MSPQDDATSDADGSDRRLDEGRHRLEDGADRAIEEFDKRIIDLLSWLLETETRARIYVYLRQHPASTSEEIAEGTGLYPSTVREAIVELHDEEVVSRNKRESDGAGNNPFEYEAIAPSDLVKQGAKQVQAELNAVLCLDEYLDGDDPNPDTDAVSISIDEDVDTA